MNCSEEPIELMKGTKIASFQQLTEIRSVEPEVSFESVTCGAAVSDSFKSQVDQVISAHLSNKDKREIKSAVG